MIEEFLSSWPLFQDAYLAGWLIALLLAIVGVLVVARDQIFLGAAVSQASTLGIAAALGLGAIQGDALAAEVEWIHEAGPFFMAIAFSIMAALIIGHTGVVGRDSYEAVTGWIFLISASLSIIVVWSSPHGIEEVHSLLFSEIIGVTRLDLYGFSSLAVVTIVAVALHYRRLLLLIIDPEMASAVGMKVGRWGLAISAWLGLAIGLSIHASGLLYTFGCLVLPGLIAKNLTRNVAPMFIVAPIIALVTTTTGFIFAHSYELPLAQLSVALMSVALACVWIAKRLTQRQRS